MRNGKWLLVPLLTVGFAFSTFLASGQQTKEDSKDKEAIAKNADAFVEAFHKGDAKTLASFWTAKGDYTNKTGKHLEGQEAIEKAFAKFFEENKDLKLRIDSDSLRFVTPEVAIEDGTTSVLPPDDGPPSQARYTIVHVKKEGKWFIDSVREAPFASPTNHEHLRVLEWMIGDWSDDAEKGEIARVSYAWSETQNFIVSSFATTFKNISVGSGTQWIGWDPIAKNIRSWTFDADGGFGEGSWSMEKDKLVIKMNLVLRDGKKVSATNIVTRIDPDTITWQSKSRTLDGKPLDDIKEVKMKRNK
jgi:uncharacterized protein (TIGR02246 family)